MAATTVGVIIVTAHSLHGEGTPEQAAPLFRHSLAGFPDAAVAHAHGAPPALAGGSSTPRTALALVPGATAGTQTRPLNRAELREAVTSGKLSLGDVLERHDETTGRVVVGRIVRLLPGYLPERLDSLIESSGVDEKRHIADLSEDERRRLLAVFDGHPE
jgi:hypothetical protein